MGPTEHTRWQLDTPLSAEAVIDALVDFSPRRNTQQAQQRSTCTMPSSHGLDRLSAAFAEPPLVAVRSTPH